MTEELFKGLIAALDRNSEMLRRSGRAALMHKEVLSPEEAAEYCEKAVKTLHEAARKGELLRIKKGRKSCAFHRSDLEAWLGGYAPRSSHAAAKHEPRKRQVKKYGNMT
jgi:hypothetical protein